MTEYDYSPEAVNSYLRKQRAISRWVQQTEEGPMRDPYTPATPAANAYSLEVNAADQDDVRKHHPGQSYDHYDRLRDWDSDRHRDRDRDRDRDKERGMDKEGDAHGRDKPKARSLHHSRRPSNTERHRSASQSATLQSATLHSVPGYHVPPPLPLPPQPWQMPYSQQPSPPTTPYPQYYPQKFASPRDSKPSSHSSSTTRLHSPNSHFPQTSPHHSPDTNYGYPQPQPVWRKISNPIPDFTNAPQYPHSAYQVKQPPTLFRRLLKGLTGGNKQVPQRVPRRKRSSSF